MPNLREMVTFRRYIETDDGRGNVTYDWVDVVTAPAALKFLRGGETVMAGRLQARQGAILTVRNFPATAGIQPKDIAVNARTGEQFNIRERPRETAHRGYLEMLVESGVDE